jgi:hypothetical protein
MRARWLRHVPKFVLKIIDLVLGLNFLFQFCDDLPEKNVDHKCVDCTFMIHVKHSPEVVQRLG